jgi:hypothetical protein
MRLTDISIRTLPVPAKGQKTYFDESLTSFGCRVSQGGTRSFVVQHGADRQLITIGRYPIISLSEARAQAKHILAERTLGKHRPRSIPFDDAVSLFLAACEQRNRPRTVKDYTRILKQHFPFARMQLSAIMPQDINRRLDRLHGTPAEQTYALIVIKIFFNWAVTRHYLDANPCARFKRPSRADARERVLTDASTRRRSPAPTPFRGSLPCLFSPASAAARLERCGGIGSTRRSTPSRSRPRSRKTNVPTCFRTER